MSDEFTTTTEFPPVFAMADNSDPSTSLNMRSWLQKALEEKGAKIVGAGFGCGVADLDIELEGCRFNIEIKPIHKAP